TQAPAKAPLHVPRPRHQAVAEIQRRVEAGQERLDACPQIVGIRHGVSLVGRQWPVTWRTSLSTKLPTRLPRLRTNWTTPAATKYGSRMLSRVSTSGPTGSAECQLTSLTAKA